MKVLEKRIVESVVRAPFAGRVAERFVDPGTIVTASARLVRIVQVSPLRIRFDVPEADVPRLARGATVSILTKAGDTTATAKVTGMASEVSRERRVAAAEGMIENPPASWLPGMYAEAIVDLRTIENATIVPATAVISRLGRDGKVTTGVFLVQNDVARWIPVREVTRDGERVAVEGELPAGARVLAAGHVDLDDGAKITVGAKS